MGAVHEGVLLVLVVVQLLRLLEAQRRELPVGKARWQHLGGQNGIRPGLRAPECRRQRANTAMDLLDQHSGMRKKGRDLRGGPRGG